MRTEATPAVDLLVGRLAANLEQLAALEQAQANLILQFDRHGIPAAEGLTLPEWVQEQLGIHRDRARELVVLARQLDLRSTDLAASIPSHH